MRKWLRWIGVALSAAALAACAAPAPERVAGAPAARSAADQSVGARAHPAILAQHGGAVGGKVAAYVGDIGARLAPATGQAAGPWKFTVLDSPAVNAFALPGGYVYVTRGLVALANDEAELAGVVGHEMGHVVAAHSAERKTQSTVAQVGVLAAVIGAAVLGADGALLDAVGQGAGALAGGAVASYSRAQELEADRLGVAYLAGAGYDPAAQADFLRSMQAQDGLSARLAGAGYDPNRVDFFASHPATAERVRAAEDAARRAGGPGGARDRARYLAAVDGLTYGDSAEQGFVRGGGFVHPRLGFAFDAPPGYRIVNSADRVTLRGPRGGAVVFDGGRDPGGSLENYVARDWAGALARQTDVGALRDLRRFNAGGAEGVSAALPVRTNRGVALAHMAAVRTGDGQIYRFFGLGAPDDAAAGRAVAEAARSFRKLSRAEAARERPWRIAVTTVRPGDTVESLSARMPFDDARAERFRVLNGLAPGAQPRPGDRVKLVLP